MLSEIKKVDNTLSDLIKSLNYEAEKLKFNFVCDFKLNNHHIEEIPWGELNYAGVYLIEVKNNHVFNSFEPWLADY